MTSQGVDNLIGLDVVVEVDVLAMVYFRNVSLG